MNTRSRLRSELRKIMNDIERNKPPPEKDNGAFWAFIGGTAQDFDPNSVSPELADAIRAVQPPAFDRDATPIEDALTSIAQQPPQPTTENEDVNDIDATGT